MPDVIIQSEKTSSIDLKRTSKGQYSWEIKLYFDKDNEKAEDIVKETERLNDLMIKDLGEK